MNIRIHKIMQKTVTGRGLGIDYILLFFWYFSFLEIFQIPFLEFSFELLMQSNFIVDKADTRQINLHVQRNWIRFVVWCCRACKEERLALIVCRGLLKLMRLRNNLLTIILKENWLDRLQGEDIENYLEDTLVRMKFHLWAEKLQCSREQKAIFSQVWVWKWGVLGTWEPSSFPVVAFQCMSSIPCITSGSGGC